MAHGASSASKPSFMDMLRALAQPHVRVMLLLGFASGLPFLLSVGTLGAWLATAHIDVKTIGLMSLAGGIGQQVRQNASRPELGVAMAPAMRSSAA